MNPIEAHRIAADGREALAADFERAMRWMWEEYCR